MTDLAKLPVTVITGFLGSGKTTLIRHLMQNAGGKRLAVVVNEFGDVGVDGEILKSCAIPDCPAENIMELANGCICCTVADDFIPTIEALMALDPRPDHILIETSGLALPKPLLKAFDWPDIRSRITVDGVIAVADAEAVGAGRFAPNLAAVDAQRAADDSIDHETPLSEVFEDQISCADIVLLTKPDLAGPEGLATARAVIEAEAPRKLPVVEVAEGVVDPRVILGIEPRPKTTCTRAPAITTARPTMTTTISKASWSSCRNRPTRRSLPGASRRLRGNRTSCASRATQPFRASRCGCWCRRWARACATSTIAPGVRTNRVARASW